MVIGEGGRLKKNGGSNGCTVLVLYVLSNGESRHGS